MQSMHVSRVWIVAFLALGAGPGGVFAQSLADRAPADTLIYVGWRGTQSPGPGYDSSNLRGFLGASQIPQFCEKFLPELAERLVRDDKDAARALAVFRAVAGPLSRHPSAFFFTGVDFTNPDLPIPRLGLMSDAGNEAAALLKQIQDLLQQVGELPLPVRVVRSGDLVLLTVGYQKGEDALAGAGAANSLAQDADFTAALGQVSKDAVFTGYVQFVKLIAVFDQVVAKIAPPDAQQMWPKAKEALGLATVRRVIWSQGFAGKDWETRIFVAASQPRQGLLGSMLGGKPLSKDIYAAIPQNASMAGAVMFNAAGFISAIRTAAGQIDPDISRQIDQVLHQVSQTVGVDVEKDFLGSLGDEWAYYVDPTVIGRGMLGTTVVNRLKDPAGFERSVLKLERFVNDVFAQQLKADGMTVEFRETKLGDATVHYLATPLFTPAWVVRDGNLYVAAYPQVAAAAAAHVADKGKSILDNPAFAELRKRMAPGAADSMQFVDLPKVAPESYASWVAISRLDGFGDLFGLHAPPALLPSLGRAMPYLSAAGQAMWNDAAGVHFRALSPFPGSTLLAADPLSMGAAEPAIMISIMLPALNRAREQASRVKSASNLRQIGLGAMMYANADPRNDYPLDLGTLLKAQELGIHVFLNPRSSTPLPPDIASGGKDQQAAWVNQNSDYEWFGAGRKSGVPANELLAAEKPAGLQEGLNVLYGDGRVEFVPLPTAKELIQKAKSARQRPERGPGL